MNETKYTLYNISPKERNLIKNILKLSFNLMFLFKANF